MPLFDRRQGGQLGSKGGMKRKWAGSPQESPPGAPTEKEKKRRRRKGVEKKREEKGSGVVSGLFWDALDLANPPVFTAISPDTSVSATDQITTARNLTISGTAAKGATVTVSRAGVGVEIGDA